MFFWLFLSSRLYFFLMIVLEMQLYFRFFLLLNIKAICAYKYILTWMCIIYLSEHAELLSLAVVIYPTAMVTTSDVEDVTVLNN
jgi:hypothetical protein